MKNIENEYNKRFKNQEMDNADFDVDGLWEAITDDLDGAAPPPTPPNGRPIFKFFGWSALVLLIAGASYIYLSKVEDTQRLATKNGITKEQLKAQHPDNQLTKTKHQNKETTANSSDLEKNITSTDPKDIDLNQTNATFDISPKSQVATLPTKKSIKNLAPINKKDISRKSPLSNHTARMDIKKQPAYNTQGNIQKQKVTTHIKTDQTLPTKTDNPNKLETSIAENKSYKESTQIKTSTNPTQKVDAQKTIVDNLTLDKTTIGDVSTNEISKTQSPLKKASQPNNDADSQISSHTNPNTSTPPTTKTIVDAAKEKIQIDSLATHQDQMPNIKPTKLKNIHWTMGLLGGTNKTFFHFNSKDELATLRNKYEKGTWGTYIGVNVGMIWNNKILLSSGLEYHTLWSKIDYTQNKTGIQDSVLQQVVFQNGEITNMIYDSLTYSSQSQIIWNNLYKTYRIPLEIGYQKHFKRWTLGTKVGAIFNFTTSQKGKTFNNEKVIAHFAQADSFAPLKSFQVGFRVSPFVDFQVTDRASLRFEPNWNTYKGQTANIQEVGLGLSLRVKL